MAISKREWTKRKTERLKREKNYRADYQKEKYKFINVQFRLDDSKDVKILEYLEQQQESRAKTIKKILYNHIAGDKELKKPKIEVLDKDESPGKKKSF